MNKYISILTGILFLYACNRNGNNADAYGSFEADEIIVSAEANGKLLSFNVEEGMNLKKGEVVGEIDSEAVYLQLKQLMTQKELVASKLNQINAQKDIYQSQMDIVKTEKNRVEKLFKDGAATQKQMDDVSGQFNVLNNQLHLVNTQLQTVQKELKGIDVQAEILELNLDKCKITNPVNAMVVERYVEPHELVNMGKSLYKIATMNKIFLKAYVSEPQLSTFLVGDTATVYCDGENDSKKSFKGVVTWISSKAEFTPKVVQTEEERVNLVYAVKIEVENDGTLKIGMPGEVKF